MFNRIRRNTYVFIITFVIVLIIQMCLVFRASLVRKHASLHTTEDLITSRRILDMSQFGNEWRRKAMIFKTEERKQRFITIGIPTVRRQKSSYLMDTLDSLVHFTSYKSICDIYIVVFIADFNTTWRYEIANKLTKRYTNLIKNGTMHLIQAPKEFYPSFDDLNHTYVDPESKKKWRSKQNVDYVFLWLYSKPLSKYYMQMEDDIFTIPGYLDIIKNFIATRVAEWTCLEFSELGFIGKVYYSKDLERLAKMILLFYEEQPVDETYIHFNQLNFQPKRIIRRPTIFQHIGYHSSLEGKIQSLKDKFFDPDPKSLKGNNPPATLFTTLKVSPDFSLQTAYSHDIGYFWAQSVPTIQDSIHIIFNEPQELEKVVILSGSLDFPTNKFEYAQLDACLTIQEHMRYIKCFNLIYLGTSINGTILASNLHTKLNTFKVTCLQISFTKNHHFLLIVKEIAVFVK